MQLTIGILGCGTIGSEIAAAIADGTIDARLGAVYDRHPERATDTISAFAPSEEPTLADSVTALASAVDLVVETAGHPAVAEHGKRVLDAECDLMLLSVGALVDNERRSALLAAAERTDASIHVPSGAIAGLDAIKASAVTGELEDVTLSTTKPPAGLEGAPYIGENDIDLSALTEPTTVFEGDAAAAADAFPSNINVAAALSLAGIGVTETTVTIVADPAKENNVHRIEASGSAGRIETEVQNVASPTNPKTSYLAALSAIETLREMTATLRVGT
ncbi:aspartate dehydrogenase [Haloarcula amylovorans]|uniref:aspartate dehydrogenase n=1 Tax=Haloarcula amylovorans TaxID=2562280 RepID=UPI001ADDC7F2|nr:aspartate dehydrogenase [Halomicroarcula amylolytica]